MDNDEMYAYVMQRVKALAEEAQDDPSLLDITSLLSQVMELYPTLSSDPTLANFIIAAELFEKIGLTFRTIAYMVGTEEL